MLKPLQSTKLAAERYHGRIPYLRRLPAKGVAMILAVAVVNALVWAAVGVVLHFNRSLTATAVLAYTLGLRHALDADHIAAIDLMTRRLIASGQRPTSVGFFFSLGHSTIVIITSIAVAATSASLSEKFDTFSKVGGIIGTSVSAAFLVTLAMINAWVLWSLWGKMGRVLEKNARGEGVSREIGALDEALNGAGCMTRVLKGVFGFVDRSWKMYPLGVLFGLGFDTSSEIALLGISSLHGLQGTSIWLILIFPVLFTAGMCLLDTTDGALMSALYQTSSFSQDIVAVLYYSIVLTIITVIVAIVIGTIQVLNVVLNVADPATTTGQFWVGVERVGEWYDVLGGAIVGLFIVGAVVGTVVYAPWRRWREKKWEDKVRKEREAGGQGREDGEREKQGTKEKAEEC
ncbi:high-affinity nickel-transport protein-domain-containing protein [Pyronema domesticum]|uniref:Nickel/cobalt efflux system n=1 Tax=Pyronema omphalodes (strain CBS 100304) TaxID=1076935 RepID=U4L6I5_PYROM|nr:high-affinity nickel-transport protein-domain-containing protein [Pyronema domesticum]CCX05640.1 Similar to High-affinity nickel transport protein nic1; acc. no. O74869 [Pyronema omphalodes CBS 100304]